MYQMTAYYLRISDWISVVCSSAIMVPGNLAAYDVALLGGIPGGNPIPTSAVASTTCQNGSCTSWGYNGTAFTNIVTRMQMMMPEIQAANVLIDYENVGLGYAGDPNGPDVSPLVRVRLAGLAFTPLRFALFGPSVQLPDFFAAPTKHGRRAGWGRRGRE